MTTDEQIIELKRVYNELMTTGRRQNPWRAFKVLETIAKLEARKKRSEKAKARLAAKAKL